LLAIGWLVTISSFRPMRDSEDFSIRFFFV
jgi:hypothetical protein